MGAAGSRRSRARVGWLRTRSVRGCGSLTVRSSCRPVGCARRVGVPSVAPTPMRRCSQIWGGWSIATRGAIRSGRCCGRPRAFVSWPGACVSSGHEVSYRTVARLLHQLGYSLQANRKTASRPRRAVQAYQREGDRRDRAEPAGDQHRYQEEGARRRVRKRRAGVGSQGRAGRGQRARLPRQDARQGDPLRHL